MAVEQKIICDKCGKPIDGNHVELNYVTRSVNPDDDDHVFESNVLQYHLECFDAMREALKVGNPQKQFREAKVTQKREAEQRQKDFDKLIADKPEEIQMLAKTLFETNMDMGQIEQAVANQEQNDAESARIQEEMAAAGDAVDEVKKDGKKK